MSDQIAERLAAAGFIAAPEEAEELRAAARGNGFLLDSMVSQRLEGQPLAWITGRTVFCGLEVQIDPGVYVPRTHSEGLAERAAELLPERGFAIDLCTGSGAIAMVLSHRRPGARVLATDVDPVAVDCARANGVAAHRGDLFSALPPGIDGLADVVVAVVPYVPEAELGLLQRDTLRFETRLSYDGGPDGLAVLRRIPREALRRLRGGGSLLLEAGGEQEDGIKAQLESLGYEGIRSLRDAEGDFRGIEAQAPERG